MAPRRVAVGVRLTAEQIAWLDELAERLGVDRSEIVRRAIDANRRPPSPLRSA